MRILILNCDMDKSKITNGSSIINRLLHKKYKNARVDIYNSFEERFPSYRDLRNYDRVIITGSRASVYEDEKWIHEMKEVIAKIDRLGIPTLGICFGFQIVAEAFGGKVVHGERFIEGFRKIRITGKNIPIFYGIGLKDKFYESHEDILRKMPKGGRIVAKQDGRTEAYVLRKFYCLQFHPEILPDIATIMAERDGKKTSKILNGVGANYETPANIIYNFIDLKAE